MAPPIVLALAKHPLVDKYDLSALQSVFSGAAPLDASLERACTERLGCAVMQGWGLTRPARPSYQLQHPRGPSGIGQRAAAQHRDAGGRPGHGGRRLQGRDRRAAGP